MEKSRITVRFDAAGRANIPEGSSDHSDTKETDAAESEKNERNSGRSREQRMGVVIPLRAEPEYPYDYGAWKHDPGHDSMHDAVKEADELEQMIRDAELEARKRETADLEAELGFWEEDISRKERSVPYRTAILRGSDAEASPSWWKMAGSILGAVATGILFGTLLMNVFTGDEPVSAPPMQESSEGGAKQGETSAGAADERLSGKVPGSGIAAEVPQGGGAAVQGGTSAADIEIPERRMWLLQYGKFETLDNARAMAESIREKGFAATIEEADGFYVYAGVASDRDAALRTGVKLQAEGLDVYVKPYELPPVRQVRWEEGSAESLAGYLARGSELVRLIGDLTFVHFEGEPVAPEPSTLEKLRAEHLGLQELQAAAYEGLPSDAQPMLERMDIAARNAVTAVEEYGARPDHAYLWSAQSALIDYLIAEKQLLTAIALN